MPWCPKCHSEYDKGIKVCYDCQCDLVDELPHKDKNELQSVKEAFLMTVADEMEYRIVEAKLGQYGIPVSMRYRDSGAVTYIYMGRTFGLDMYVPEAALPQAKEIMADIMGNDEADVNDHQEDKADIYQKGVRVSERGVWGRKIVLVFIIMILIVLGLLAVMYLISFLNLI